MKAVCVQRDLLLFRTTYEIESCQRYDRSKTFAKDPPDRKDPFDLKDPYYYSSSRVRVDREWIATTPNSTYSSTTNPLDLKDPMIPKIRWIVRPV